MPCKPVIEQQNRSCCQPNNGVDLQRRTLLKRVSAGVAAMSTGVSMPIMAGPFNSDNESKNDSEGPIPVDKKLDQQWLKTLVVRGKPTTYRGWQQLQYIGMPVSGIGTGTVYVGGDGKLWVWDIFNENHEGVVPQTFQHSELRNEHGDSDIKARNGANYINPPAQTSPWHFNQGFAITIAQHGEQLRRTLDNNGFSDINFTGQMPIAEVQYNDRYANTSVSLEAMTPFIPLDSNRSSYPATIMRYKITNESDAPIDIAFEAWSENPVLQGRANHYRAELVATEFSDKNGAGFICGCNGQNTAAQHTISTRADYGSFALYCLNRNAQVRLDKRNENGIAIHQVESKLTLAPGQTEHVTFIVAWHFANQKALWKKQHRQHKRWYASKYSDAMAVALDVAQSFDQLYRLTKLWRDNWFASSLPHWLLERTIIPTNALQTNTSYRLDNGRFWAWEGIGCCAGTCAHVWHYAQAVGRLFPDLERDLRERTDYGIGQKSNGAISFRGEYGEKDATDGQAGIILRTYREHQMSRDSAFLNRVWPNAKKAMQYLILVDARNGMPDGIPQGEQHNTLDAEWYGKIPVHGSLYIAALRACIEMASIVGDDEFKTLCTGIYTLGKRNIIKLFNVEYGFFTQQIDPNHTNAIGIGDGCYIDQVMGQWWASQLNLGRLYDGEIIRASLNSLWDYNFCPDVGRLRDSIENPKAKGRTYALAGEAGLVMCTWPKGGRADDWQQYWQYGYFNECMTGFEYQVGGHMIWESEYDPELLTKGLAITRAVHDRYQGDKRNPFNEIECSDHYARAMASYGVFLAVCGFEYDGPKKHIGFKPRLDNKGYFKAAFTSADGWGNFECKDNLVRLSILYGELELATLSLRIKIKGLLKRHIETDFGDAVVSTKGADINVLFTQNIIVKSGQVLTFSLV
ncbi:GH116 family glycosyl hydrolase [Thalassotalea sp. HSM 43]|uniref:GH116 family glycosyl hydrolase n=1 Tax=Thalassotalea sp. HSM 43 TaxID=2552945 RepID=UPI001E467215|nr:GH116 family glycosyl hydrolase [Thalassotalea sp. HSM 43]